MRVLLLLTVSAVLVGLVRAKFPLIIIRACVKESKVKALDLAILYGNQSNVTTKEVKCYFSCLFESLGIIVDGKINTLILGSGDSSNEEIHAGKRIMEACKDVEASGECELGYQLHECFVDYGRKAIVNQPAEERDIE